ncbi:MAG: hypothetical protein HKN41_12420 [Ilumatobacter sp.]|nr:hypothetical protein [Ilumatobacter sp.]
MYQPGDRIRWESLGDDGFPVVQYGFVRGTNGDESRIVIMLDGELKSDRVVPCDELAPVTITNIELRLRGVDLLADPSLRQGLVNLWSAEADQAGLQVRSIDYLGHDATVANGKGCALAELLSGGQHYILRARTPSADEVWVKADRPGPDDL